VAGVALTLQQELAGPVEVVMEVQLLTGQQAQQTQVVAVVVVAHPLHQPEQAAPAAPVSSSLNTPFLVLQM